MTAPAISRERAPLAMEKAAINERIVRSAAPVADWAATRLQRDIRASSCIGELYADYENFCRQEKCRPLARKTWIAALKLAGFETQSGGFAGLRLRVELIDGSL